MAVPKVHEMAIFSHGLHCFYGLRDEDRLRCHPCPVGCNAMRRHVGQHPVQWLPACKRVTLTRGARRLLCLTLHFVELVRKFAAQVHRRDLRCRFLPIRRHIVRRIELLHHSHPIFVRLFKRPQCQALARRFIQRCLIYARNLRSCQASLARAMASANREPSPRNVRST